MKNQFYCGVAKVDITPDESYLKNLFGLMGMKFAGIIDYLKLRVIALSAGEGKSLIISFDLDKAPNPKEWIMEIVERTGIKEENILYIGTHTHSAPLTTVRQYENDNQNVNDDQRAAMLKYESFVHEKMFQAIDSALGSMIPVRIGSATGESHINVNRNADLVYTAPDGAVYPYVSQGMNMKAPVDRSLFVMKIEDESGKVIALLTNYAVHCCVMFCNDYDGNQNMGISGDIAGNISAVLEERYPDSVAVWSSGAAGDVNPLIMNAVMYPKTEDGSYAMEVVGPYTTTKKLLDMLVGWHYKDILDTISMIKHEESDGEIQGVIEWSETPGDNAAKDYENGTYKIRLHALNIGDTTLLGIGGELYTYFGQLLKEIAPAKNLVIINHDASLIEDASYIHDDGTLERIEHKAPIFAMVPGGDPGAVKGFLEDSLKKHIESMSSRLFKR